MSTINYTQPKVIQLSRNETPFFATVCMEDIGDWQVKLTIKNAINMTPVKTKNCKVIPFEEYENRPTNPDNKLVEAKWALGQFGVSV